MKILKTIPFIESGHQLNKQMKNPQASFFVSENYLTYFVPFVPVPECEPVPDVLI